MNKIIRLSAPLLLALFSACSRSTQISTIKSPAAGIFYTVETYEGQGAIDNDYTRVYLHMERSGQSDKALVLSGTYVVVSKVEWINATENVIFTENGGFTDTFRNQVTLRAGGVTETFHAYLQENRAATKAQ
jgi:hypothetical protein